MNGMDERQQKINERMPGPLDPDSPAALRNRIATLEAALRSAIEDLEWHGAVGEAERCRAALDKDAG